MAAEDRNRHRLHAHPPGRPRQDVAEQALPAEERHVPAPCRSLTGPSLRPLPGVLQRSDSASSESREITSFVSFLSVSYWWMTFCFPGGTMMMMVMMMMMMVMAVTTRFESVGLLNLSFPSALPSRNARFDFTGCEETWLWIWNGSCRRFL